MIAIETGKPTEGNPLGIGVNPTYRMNQNCEVMPLYIIPLEDEGFSTMGVSYVCKEIDAIAKEMNPYLQKQEGHSAHYLPASAFEYGSLELYYHYKEIAKAAYQRHKDTGWRSKHNLTKQLVGLEGKVVEVIDKYDDRRTFIVGKSGGWAPCHLEIEDENEGGGEGAYGTPYKSVRVIKS